MDYQIIYLDYLYPKVNAVMLILILLLHTIPLQWMLQQLLCVLNVDMNVAKGAV